jgi:hypothetical protein
MMNVLYSNKEINRDIIEAKNIFYKKETELIIIIIIIN